MDLGQLVDLLKRNAELAVTFDSEGNKEAAGKKHQKSICNFRNNLSLFSVYYYHETVAQIKLANSLNTVESGNQIDLSSFIKKSKEYVERAETLKSELNQDAIDAAKKAHASSSDLERAKFCLLEALDLDEKGLEEEAVDLYAKAVELCLTAQKTNNDEKLKKNLNKIASQALDRAEQIKNRDQTPPAAQAPPLAATSVASTKPKQRVIPPLGIEGLGLNDSSETSRARSGGGYTEEEKKVLAKTSLINGREYVPFLSVDLKERFAFPMPFSDKDGLLSLAPKQKAKLVKWARPEEFMSNPFVIYSADCLSAFLVKQTVVSDCSFVASIAISAQYERKHGKKLITSIIYPQDKSGTPVYNPCGKYMVKLRINGVTRKVIIGKKFILLLNL